MPTVKRIANVFGVSPDELLDSEQPIEAVIDSGDHREQRWQVKFRQVLDLAAEDRAMIFRLIDPLSMQKQLQTLLSPGATRIERKRLSRFPF